MLGLAIRAWAAGHIRKNAQLATSGPYAFTRNPLYFGSFLLGLGFTIASGRWYLAVLFAALFIGIYLPTMRVEASTMEQLFGNDFEIYRRSVPLFFPRLTPYRQENSAAIRFDGALYLRYREYRAALDACDMCYHAKKGYHQEGEDMICNNCGLKFHSSLINKVAGGCNPIGIATNIDGDQLVIKASDLERGGRFF